MQTINSCLKALEKSGYVRLDFLKGSRKSKQVCLTEQGEKIAEKVVAPMIHSENEAFASLTQDEQQSLLRITQKHNTLLRKHLLE